MGQPVDLVGNHHVEWYVGNALQSAYYFQRAWGFKIVAYKGLETGSRDRVSFVLQQGKIRFILTAPLTPDGPINAFLNRHGDGVRNVAFQTGDAGAAYKTAVANGAEPVEQPGLLEDDTGTVVKATIRAYDDVQHTFIEPGDYTGIFLPGYQPYEGPSAASAPAGLKIIDHIVNNMPEKAMEPTVDWYQNILGFHRFWSVDDKDIRTDYTALKSVVVANDNERIKMPINEPAPGLRKSQIQEFIDYNIDAGIQHIALLTNDILSTITDLRANGVDFLEVPDTYYTDLPDRVGRIDESLEAIRNLRILVDRDEDGYLLQLFTKPIQDRPTFFFEVIQRKGCRSFGKGNFKALFEAIEREQARRGNL